MRIRLNRAYFPVTTLGPGRRIGLWLQGCHIRCRGCVARDTWKADPSKELDLDDIFTWCRNLEPKDWQGVTISGGEPFEQPEALKALLDGLDSWRCELERPFDILCYSGFSLRRLERDYPEILSQLDALIPEPYVERLPRGGLWRGSMNQPIVALSRIGRERYTPYLDAVPAGKGALQVSVHEKEAIIIGIPGRRDMDRLEDAVKRRGILLKSMSWRA